MKSYTYFFISSLITLLFFSPIASKSLAYPKKGSYNQLFLGGNHRFLATSTGVYTLNEDKYGTSEFPTIKTDGMNSAPVKLLSDSNSNYYLFARYLYNQEKIPKIIIYKGSNLKEPYFKIDLNLTTEDGDKSFLYDGQTKVALISESKALISYTHNIEKTQKHYGCVAIVDVKNEGKDIITSHKCMELGDGEFNFKFTCLYLRDLDGPVCFHSSLNNKKAEIFFSKFNEDTKEFFVVESIGKYVIKSDMRFFKLSEGKILLIFNRLDNSLYLRNFIVQNGMVLKEKESTINNIFRNYGFMKIDEKYFIIYGETKSNAYLYFYNYDMTLFSKKEFLGVEPYSLSTLFTKNYVIHVVFTKGNKVIYDEFPIQQCQDRTLFTTIGNKLTINARTLSGKQNDGTLIKLYNLATFDYGLIFTGEKTFAEGFYYKFEFYPNTTGRVNLYFSTISTKYPEFRYPVNRCQLTIIIRELLDDLDRTSMDPNSFPDFSTLTKDKYYQPFVYKDTYSNRVFLITESSFNEVKRENMTSKKFFLAEPPKKFKQIAKLRVFPTLFKETFSANVVSIQNNKGEYFYFFTQYILIDDLKPRIYVLEPNMDLVGFNYGQPVLDNFKVTAVAYEKSVVVSYTCINNTLCVTTFELNDKGKIVQRNPKSSDNSASFRGYLSFRPILDIPSYCYYTKNKEIDVTSNDIFTYLYNSKECSKPLSKLEEYQNTPDAWGLIPDRPELHNVEKQTFYLYNHDTAKCPHHPRTIYFRYNTSFLNETFVPETKLDKVDITEKKYMVVYKADSFIPSVIVDIFKYNNISETSYYTDSNMVLNRIEIDRVEALLKDFNQYQRYNHFPNCFNLHRKNILYDKYKKMQSKFPKDYTYMPETYVFPRDKKLFEPIIKDYKLTEDNLWLIKPTDMSRGRGISILEDRDSLPSKGLVTQYIAFPHLINGKKYDLRLYLLITGYLPLKMYLFEDGLVRIASEPYNLNLANISNKFIHLTNYAINKYSASFEQNNDEIEESGNKWTVQTLKKKFIRDGMDFDSAWSKIKDIMIKIAMSQADVIPTLRSFKIKSDTIFELYGVDILLDRNLRPWLMEVNLNPQINTDSMLDLKLKSKLLTDIYNLVGFVPFSHDGKHKILDKVFRFKDKIQESIEDSICEFSRPHGGFERIFPLKENINKYKKFLSDPGEENNQLWEHIQKNE